MDYSNEIADGGITYYTSMTALDGTQHDTAVFIPSNFHQDPTLNLILYLHGHAAGYHDIRQYIHRANTRPLRSSVAADGRFALVMPWLGTGSNANHIVTTAPAFDLYLTAICAQVIGLTAPALAFMSPSIRLVLAAHSGGGQAMDKAIALGASVFIPRVISAWGFDCFYSDSSAIWIRWARANPGKTMYMYYTAGGTPQTVSERINAGTGSNVAAALSRVGHDLIPKEYFPDLLSTIP